MSARLVRPGRSSSPTAGGDPGHVAGNMARYTSTGDETFPPVDQELVQALREHFAIQLNEGFDLRAYDRQLGAHQVIEFLQKIHNVQNKQ